MKILYLSLMLIFLFENRDANCQAISNYYFIMPKTGTGIDRENGFRPQYIKDRNECFGSVDLGGEPYFLVMAQMTDAARDSIADSTGVVAFPKNIDVNLIAKEVTDFSADLESRNIPGNWITTSDTFRDVIRFVMITVQLNQRYNGLTQGSKIFRSGVGLNTKHSEFSDNEKQRWINVADSFEFEKSSLRANSEIRFMLKELNKQWIGTLHMGCGVEL